MITKEQIDQAYAEHVNFVWDECTQKWWAFFGDNSPAGANPPARHSKESARAIVESCLMLGVPVSDVLTGESWRTVVRRLADMDDRLTRLEQSHGV